MFGTRKLASRGILAAGLAGLAMLAAAPAADAASAAAGPAAPSSYSTWSAAQKAAGFTLYAPKYTGGLKRTNKILVTKCEVTGKTRFHDVFAQWGGKTFLALDQNNSGSACSNFGAAKSLGTYTSGGISYKLYGFCGTTDKPSCTSTAAPLVLVWKIGSRYNVAYSHGVLRGTLEKFATSIKKV
jgi:hypothetical protein